MRRRPQRRCLRPVGPGQAAKTRDRVGPPGRVPAGPRSFDLRSTVPSASGTGRPGGSPSVSCREAPHGANSTRSIFSTTWLSACAGTRCTAACVWRKPTEHTLQAAPSRHPAAAMATRRCRVSPTADAMNNSVANLRGDCASWYRGSRQRGRVGEQHGPNAASAQSPCSASRSRARLRGSPGAPARGTGRRTRGRRHRPAPRTGQRVSDRRPPLIAA